MAEAIKTVEIDGERALAMYLRSDFTLATEDDYDLLQLTFEKDGRRVYAEAEADVEYVENREEKPERCANCRDYTGDGVCMSARVQLDPAVKENDEKLKLVAERGWCKEWNALEEENER